MKRIVSIILAMSILLSLFIIPSSAANTPEDALGELNIFSGGFPMQYLAVNGKVQKQEYTYFLDDTPSGETKEIPAYCVTPNQYGVPQTVNKGESIKYLAEKAASDPKIVGLVANMYPHRSLEELGLENLQQAFYAGKIALWCYLIPEWDISKVTVNPALTGEERTRAEKILTATINIYNRGMAWTSVPKPRLDTAADRAVAYPVTVDGRQYKQQIFTVTSDTWVCDYKVKIAFSSPDDVPAGTRITDMDNKNIDTVIVSPNGGIYNGKFKVLYPAESVEGESGSVQFSLNAEVYQYAVFYALCQEKDKYGNLQDYLADTDPQTVLQRSAVSTFDTPNGPPLEDPDTGLEILKLEEGTETPLAGAAFEVKDPDGKTIGTYTTGYDGKITIPLVVVGNYTVTETTPPKFHLLPEHPTQSVTVKYGEIAKVSFHNAPYGELRIEKIDEASGAGLSGAVLQFKNIQTGVAQSVTTMAAGVAQVSELAPGSYEVRELAAPIGYIKSDEVKTVEVRPGEVSSVTFKNQSRPGLRITKYDASTMTTLPGVTFQIYRDAALVGEYTTDALGEIVLRGIEPGTYLVQEVAAPGSHVVNSTPQQIEVKAGSTQLVELVFFNDVKPGISLVKVDAATMKPLANAKFLIQKVGDTFAKEYTTGADGTVDLSELTPGAYTVKEIVAPDGYLIDDAVRTIQLNPGENAQFVFTNTAKPTLSLLKVDSQGEALAGATFKIGRIGEDGTAYSTFITDTQGRIVLEQQEPGTYSVIEVMAPYGYVLDPTERHLELFPGKAAEVVIENKQKPNLEIIKTDAMTGEPLAGVTFTVKKVDSSTLTTVTTGPDGTVLVERLDPGVYQITEQSVPSGYLLDPTPQLITLVPNETGIVQFQNYPRPSLEIIKTNINGQAIPGAVFTVTKKDGTLVGDFTADQDGKIHIFDLDAGYYIITEKSVPAPYILDSTPHEILMVEGKTTSTTIENKRKPDLTVRKVDSVTKDPLANAKFTVWYAVNGSLSGDLRQVGSYTTDESGQFTLEAVEPGWYRVTETEAPAGYAIKDSATQDFFMKVDEDRTLTFENTPLNALVIKKVSATTGEVLQGAKFRVNYLSGVSGTGGTTIGEYTTSINGTIVITGLKAGTYVVQEIQAPAGYVLDDAPKTVYLAGNAQDVVTVEFADQPNSGLTVAKLDGRTGEPLAGAVFEVRDSAGGVVGNENGQYTTDQSGSIHFPDLPSGSYVITELQAPAGYVQNATPQTVKLQHGETHLIKFYNYPEGGLLITKLDSVTLEPLSGVKFEVRDSAGTVVGDANGIFKTDSRGTIHISSLKPGTYVVREVEAKDGYLLDTAAQSIKISDSRLYTLEFLNTPNGGLTVTKLDSHTKAPLSGAVFEVRDSRGAPVGGSNGQYTTDASGTIDLPSLPADTYTVKEIQAPEGYTLDGTPQTVKLMGGKTEKLIFYNKAKGGLLVKKLDSVTKEPLAGVKFEVTTSDGAKVGPANGIYTTDSQGSFLIPGLDPDTYVVRKVEAKDGYLLNDTPQTVEIKDHKLYTLEFLNTPTGGLLVKKLDSVTKEPLAGVKFEVTTSDGAKVGPANGIYTTDSQGTILIPGLAPGTYVVRETQAKPGYVLDDTAQTIEIKDSQLYTLEFRNTPDGGLRIIKLDEESRQPIKGVEFDVSAMDGAHIGIYRTDAKGVIYLPGLDSGWYVVTETKAADGYELDAEPHNIEVINGKTATLEVTNRKQSSVLLHKIDAVTGKGIQGVTFLVSDAKRNPVGQYTTDQNGYIYIDKELHNGKYTIREIRQAEGYILDNTSKTFYVEYGGTSEITWKNTPIMGQIQVVKKSADDNPINGLPAGTLLEGARFEITDKAGNVVDTIVSDKNGLASSKLLLLGRYTIREVQAPAYYSATDTAATVYLEHSGQIVRLETTNRSVSTGVSINKTGPKEAMSGQPVRYLFSGIANTGTIPLSSFYWRDYLPTAARLDKVVTGSYNKPLNYKIVYRVNGGEYRTLADSLRTAKTYTFDASPAALGLAANERVSEIMFVFGQVPAGFAQVEAPALFCTAVPGLVGGTSFTNTAEAGGVYNGQWIQAVTRWVTTIYGKPVPLPRTGY